MKNYIRIINLDNEVEARLIESELEKRNIPFFIQSHYDLAYDGIFQTQKGWGYIEAPPDYQDEIIKIYKDLMSEDE